MSSHGSFQIIGHRGAAGIAPENTLTGFEIALRYCDAVELDVHLVDGVLAVIHDERLERTTDGEGFVRDLKREQLASLDAGDGQVIPRLDEVIELLERHAGLRQEKLFLNIELKGPHTAPGVASIIRETKSLDLLVSSFNHGELQDFRELDGTTPVGVLYHRWRESWRETASGLNAQAVNLSERIATSKRIRSIRDEGYACYVYTVNDRETARRLASFGASGIFTDRPDLMGSLMEARG